jgi:hypothetical protein
MSPAERWITRTALPFYPWLRHQMQAAFKLPLYSPARAGILLHFMDMFAEPDLEPEMYAMLNSRIPIGDSYVFFGGLNPFPTGIPLDPSSEGLNALAPTIKLPVQLATGIELGPDDPGVSRPQDQQTSLNVFGQPKRQSALGRIIGGDIKGGLGEIGYQATGALPQTRTLRNLALGTDKWRYASGDVGGDQDRTNPIPRSLVEIGRALNLPGLPDTSRTDVEDMNDELRRAKRDLARRIRRNR